MRQRRLPTATTAATTTAAVGEIGRPRRFRLVEPTLVIEPGARMFCVCGILAGAHRGVAHRTELELLGGRALACFVIRLARGAFRYSPRILRPPSFKVGG